MQNRELSNKLSSGEIVQMKIGGTGVEKLVQTAEDVETAITTPRERIQMKGQNPVMQMEIETGGAAAQMQLVDLETGHMVANLEYHKGTQSFMLNLFDKTSGVVENELLLSHDGSCYISGDRIVVHSNIKDFATKDYVLNSIVNTYTGTTIPSPSLGKSGDKYHQYGTPTGDNLASGVSDEVFNPNGGFALYAWTQGVNLNEIYVDPEYREVELTYGSLGMPTIGDVILTIDGTQIPLTIQNQSHGGATFTYSSGFDATVASIVVGTAYSVDSDVLTGKETDYTKYGNAWHITPIYDHTYDYKQVGGVGNEVVLSTNTWTDVLDNQIEPRKAGTYVYSHSVTFTYSNTSRSAELRFSIDGGATWEEVTREVKDATNKEHENFMFPWEMLAHSPHLRFQARCESASDTLTLHWTSQILERKR